MKISAVAPLYESAPYIEALYARCVESIRSIDGADYEIVLVNDASPDDGVAIAKSIAARDPKVVVVDLARNYGQSRAVMVGLENTSGDLVFVMDGDLEDEPEWIGQFYKEMVKSGCDVVYGVQTAKKRDPFYRLGRSLFFTAMRILSGGTFRENRVSARLMTRRFVDAVVQFREREIFIDGIWDMCGYAQMPVAVSKLDRSPTTYTLPRLLSLAVNGITSFSTRPLIGIAVMGVVMCVIAFAYTAAITVEKLRYDNPEGWSSIMAAILVMGGLIILSNGIIAIYLAKIFIEVKQRPEAIVKEVYRGPAAAAERDDDSAKTDTRSAARPARSDPRSLKRLDA